MGILGVSTTAHIHAHIGSLRGCGLFFGAQVLNFQARMWGPSQDIPYPRQAEAFYA